MPNNTFVLSPEQMAQIVQQVAAAVTVARPQGPSIPEPTPTATPGEWQAHWDDKGVLHIDVHPDALSRHGTDRVVFTAGTWAAGNGRLKSGLAEIGKLPDGRAWLLEFKLMLGKKAR